MLIVSAIFFSRRIFDRSLAPEILTDDTGDETIQGSSTINMSMSNWLSGWSHFDVTSFARGVVWNFIPCGPRENLTQTFYKIYAYTI